MKSQVNALLTVTRGLFIDIRAVYPALKGLDLDEKRLTLYCQTRGLTLFTLDLPNLDALLLSALESGRLQLEGPLSKMVSKRVRVPKLFSGLWLRVFDKSACLKQDVDITALYFLRQLCCLGKRYSVECSQDRIATTLKGYHNVERELRSPTLNWAGDGLYLWQDHDRQHLADDWAPYPGKCDFGLFETPQGEEESQKEQDQDTRRILSKIQQVADLLISTMGPYDPISISESWESNGYGTGFKHGPGAVAERYAQHEKSSFAYWPAKLQVVFPYSLVAKTAGDIKVALSQHETPSRLICVPKTAKSPRLIASEPAAHQYCQQHIRAFFVERLKRMFFRKKGRKSYFVDFANQGLSGDMVLAASRSQELATVDLSDASDRLSCWVVERIFRTNPSLLSALHSARTRLLRDNISEEKQTILLRKFASQGTATTFPVQSVVFLCIALGSCIQGSVNWRNIWKLRNQVRVYGDDIIIPTRGYAQLVTAMESLQLKVNVSKSYVNGKFRESCGVDGYDGYDVTPVKPKTLVGDSPASCQAVVDTINNLFVKGNWNASYSLETTLPVRVQRGLRVVARLDAGFAGLTSFSGSDESHLTKRWNSRLHRNEVRVWSSFTPTLKRDRQGFEPLLEFFGIPHSIEQARTVSEVRQSRKTRDRLSWEPGNSDARQDIGGHE